GSAQKRWPDGLLQQGSIPLTIEKEELVMIFRAESQGITEKMIGLKEILADLDYDKLKEALRVSFEETFNVELIPSIPSREELYLAGKLEVEKYLSTQWKLYR
ncbi:MAG: hypothetical protein AB1638_12990, partial [Nitrospirota bacterium]